MGTFAQLARVCADHCAINAATDTRWHASGVRSACGTMYSLDAELNAEYATQFLHAGC